MDEKIYLERLQRNNICRACLVESTSVSLFAVEEKTGEFYSDMLMFCASVQVWEDDNLPGKVCEECAQSIARMFSFKNLCEKSDKVLRKVSTRIKTNVYYDSDEEVDEEEVEEKVNWSETKIFGTDISIQQKTIDGESNETDTSIAKENVLTENSTGSENIAVEEMQNEALNGSNVEGIENTEVDVQNEDAQIQTDEMQDSVGTEEQNHQEETDNITKTQNENVASKDATTNCEEDSQETQPYCEDSNYENTTNTVLLNQENPGSSIQDETRSSSYDDTRTSNNEDTGLSNNEDTRSTNFEDVRSSNNEDTRFSNNEDTSLSNNSKSASTNYEGINKKKRKHNDYAETEMHNRHINYEDLGIHHFDDAEHHENIQNYGDTLPSQNFMDLPMQNCHNIQNFDASTLQVQNFNYNNQIQNTPALPTYEDAVAMITYDRGEAVQHYQGANMNYEATPTYIDMSEVQNSVHPIQQSAAIQNRVIPNNQNNATLPQNVNQNNTSSRQPTTESYENPLSHLKRLLTENPVVPNRTSPSHNVRTCKPTESAILSAFLSSPAPAVNNPQKSHSQSTQNNAVTPRIYRSQSNANSGRDNRQRPILPKPDIAYQTSQAALTPTSIQPVVHTAQNAQSLQSSQNQSVPNRTLTQSIAVSYGATSSTSVYNGSTYRNFDSSTKSNLTGGVPQAQSTSSVQAPLESIEIDDDDDNSIDLTKDDLPSKSQPLLLSMLQSAPDSYKCNFCQEKFSKIVLLNQHKQSAHSREPTLKSPTQPPKITVLDNVEVKTPSPKRQRIQCTLCKDSLCIHQLLTDTPESFQCNVCGQIFENSLLLKQHLPTHKPQGTPNSIRQYKPQAFVVPHGRKPVQAQKLSQNTSKDSLSTQQTKNTFTKCTIMDQHEGYRCVICGFTCSDDVSCRDHIQFHFKDIVRLENQSFKCMNCNKICNNDKELQEHVKSHRPCACFICGKRAMSAAGLTRHYTMHIGEQCKQCGQTYERDVEKHSCDRFFTCECGKQFGTKYWFDVHRRVHHNVMFGCDKCDFKCYSNKTLVQHKLKHVAQYDFCDVTL